MGISCRMILSLPYANQFRLLAGESGLNNEVRWVHYLEEPRYAEWLKGGELIIMAGIITGDDPAKLSRLVEALFEKEAAGIVVSLSEFIPQVPKELFPLCDRLGLPLFEVPAHVRIIDISQSICRAILQQKKRADDVGAILLDLLYGKRLSDRRLQRLKSLGVSENQEFRVVQFQVDEYFKADKPGTAPALHGTAFYEEEQEEQYLCEIAELLREEIQKQTERCFLTVDQDAVLWVPEIELGYRVAPILRSLLELLSAKLPGTVVRVGVSEIFSDLRRLAVYAEHARDALRLGRYKKEGLAINFYDDMVAYQLFQKVESQEELRKMAARILQDLLLPENHELMQTLRCYIQNDCNAKRAAGELFLHANTMHYRLNKIQTMLARDLSSSEDLFDVMLALKLYEYQMKIRGD